MSNDHPFGEAVPGEAVRASVFVGGLAPHAGNLTLFLGTENSKAALGPRGWRNQRVGRCDGRRVRRFG
jgi:hypothetical protein